MDFPGGSDGKESACNVGHLSSIPELGDKLSEWTLPELDSNKQFSKI